MQFSFLFFWVCFLLIEFDYFFPFYLNFFCLLCWFWEFYHVWRLCMVQYVRAFVDNHLSWSCFQILLSRNWYFVVYKSFTLFFVQVIIGAFTSFLLLDWLTLSIFNIVPVSLFAFGLNLRIAPRWSLKPSVKCGRVICRSWVTWLQENTWFWTLKS